MLKDYIFNAFVYGKLFNGKNIFFAHGPHFLGRIVIDQISI